MRIYRRLQFGNLIDLSVLDTRQWRSDQACNDGTKTWPASLDPARTILGAEQEKWVFDNLADARARWTVLSQQVYSFARDFVKANPDARFNMDAWDGYPAARQRLYSRLKETKAPNPIVLSGDVHHHYGADLKLDFENPQSDVGVEFTNTSVSSPAAMGLTCRASGKGWPIIRTSGITATAAVTSPARRHRPRCGRTSASTCVSTPGMPIRTGGSVVVEAGKRGANVARIANPLSLVPDR